MSTVQRNVRKIVKYWSRFLLKQKGLFFQVQLIGLRQCSGPCHSSVAKAEYGRAAAPTCWGKILSVGKFTKLLVFLSAKQWPIKKHTYKNNNKRQEKI